MCLLSLVRAARIRRPHFPFSAYRRAFTFSAIVHPEVIAPGQDFSIGRILHADPLPRSLHLHLSQYLLDLLDRLAAPAE